MAFSLVFQERRSDLLQTTKVVEGRQKRMSLVKEWRCGYIFFRCTTLSEAGTWARALKSTSTALVLSNNAYQRIDICTLQARKLEFHHPYARLILMHFYTSDGGFGSQSKGSDITNEQTIA